MKRFILGLAALVGLGTPASAHEASPALQLGIEGFMAAYATYTNEEHSSNLRKFDFRKYTAIELHGEVALDNGVSVGAEIKMLADRADNGDEIIDESFVYLSSQYGRVNFGESHGAAFLLQVAVPSVDENIDGLKPYIGATSEGNLWGKYANHRSGEKNKFTYFTPVFNGLQVGASYTPSLGVDVNGLAAPVSDKRVGVLENAVEAAVRYETSFDKVDVALGGGYTHASQEVTSSDDKSYNMWNVSARGGYEAFDFGLGYTTTNNARAGKNDTKVWAAGLNYNMIDTRLGVSYRHVTDERAVQNLANKKVNAWSVGGVYNWAPGISLRSSVQYLDVKDRQKNSDIVQFTLGTQVNF